MYTKRRNKVWVKNVTPGMVGYRFDLYRLLSSTIDDKSILESSHFQKIDSRAAPIIKRLIQNPSEDVIRSDRFHLARFVLSLSVRNPWGVEKIGKIVRDSYEQHLTDPEDARRAGLPEGTTILQTMETNPHYVGDMAMLKVVETCTKRETVERLIGFNWKVWDTSRVPLELIVSDHLPLVHGHLFKDEVRTWFGLPLSPTRLLVMSNFQQTHGQASLRFVRQMNRNLAEAAVEHFFTTTRTYETLAKKRLQEHPGQAPRIRD